MNLDYKENIPEWFEEQTELDLVLSNDIDSLVSCAVLKQIKGWNIRYFYDFENCYASKALKNGHNERCWVDTSVLNEKTFDNHVCRMTWFDDYNKESINPNLIMNISGQNYQEKYAGSTALLIWSLYDLPLPETEEGKMLLLCIDSMFKGHYYKCFEESNTFYLCDMLGFEELYEVMERHEIKEFYDLIKKYNLNDTITMSNKGKLYFNIDLKRIGELLGIEIKLPDDSFLLWKKYEIVETEVKDYMNFTSDIAPGIFSLAFTYKQKVRYSREKMKKVKHEKEKDNYERFRKCIHCFNG